VSPLRGLLLTVTLSVVAAAAGAFGGAHYVIGQMRHAEPLHQALHGKLHLSPAQDRRIETLEHDYAGNRHVLEAEMRAANGDLARALAQNHAYTPDVQKAVDRFHMAMGKLQTLTIQHVLAMRAVLTPEQAASFDKTVAKVLTEEPS
jgi:Spy/CpxP family protein refolding chaperone